MATKHDLKGWVIEALNAHSGSAHHIDVARHIWNHHKSGAGGIGRPLLLMAIRHALGYRSSPEGEKANAQA